MVSHLRRPCQSLFPHHGTEHLREHHRVSCAVPSLCASFLSHTTEAGKHLHHLERTVHTTLSHKRNAARLPKRHPARRPGKRRIWLPLVERGLRLPRRLLRLVRLPLSERWCGRHRERYAKLLRDMAPAPPAQGMVPLPSGTALLAPVPARFGCAAPSQAPAMQGRSGFRLRCSGRPCSPAPLPAVPAAALRSGSAAACRAAASCSAAFSACASLPSQFSHL